jgi:hypothetical protein
MTDGELTGAELDAAVAKALGYTHHGAVGLFVRNNEKPWCLSEVNDWWKSPEGRWICGPCTGFPNAYSSDWSQGGPIIEREGIELHCMDRNGRRMQIWTARHPEKPLPLVFGESALVAAMRAFVASRSVSPPLPSVSPKGE